jgi:metallo-beta-lactamase family protein
MSWTILGSALVCLTIQNGSKEPLRIVFTGDLGRKGKPIIRDPEPVPAPDILVLESTYGDRLHETKEEALNKLAQVINETVDQRGKVIIPAFAVERTQELVYLLHLLVDEHKIPDIPIYVDSPMATNATTIFQVHPECYDQEIHEAFLKHQKNPFGFNNLHFTTSVEESKALNSLRHSALIISADGMCEAGRILHHLANNIQDPRNTVLFVGYTAENTLGRRIQDGEKEVKILGNRYLVRARIEKISAMSAHADYQETGEYLKNLDRSRLRSIYLVHGEEQAQEHLSTYLKEQGFPQPLIVEQGKNYTLDVYDGSILRSPRSRPWYFCNSVSFFFSPVSNLSLPISNGDPSVYAVLPLQPGQMESRTTFSFHLCGFSPGGTGKRTRR